MPDLIEFAFKGAFTVAFFNLFYELKPRRWWSRKPKTAIDPPLPQPWTRDPGESEDRRP